MPEDSKLNFNRHFTRQITQLHQQSFQIAIYCSVHNLIKRRDANLFVLVARLVQIVGVKSIVPKILHVLFEVLISAETVLVPGRALGKLKVDTVPDRSHCEAVFSRCFSETLVIVVQLENDISSKVRPVLDHIGGMQPSHQSNQLIIVARVDEILRGCPVVC